MILLIQKNYNKNNEIDKAFRSRFSESFNIILESLLHIEDQVIFSRIKELFFDIDWLNFSEPFTYRIEIKELCVKFLELKIEIENLLEEEKKGYGILLTNFRGKKKLCFN